MTATIPEAILTQHIAALGKTGSGKTSTAKRIIEQVVEGGARVCVLDTVKSDWWGMISSADGKKPGLPFKILGGPHGHVALHSSAGKAIGEIVASGKLPLSIIDMADFEAGGIQRFFNAFAPALLRNMRGVLYLVIEEAHEVAPKERAGFGDENMTIHYAKKLATAGRSKGIRLVVVTQRTQSLHNAVLGSCETIIAHRLTTPADQKPVIEWLKANVAKDVMEKVAAELSSLPTGTGWMCSGEAKIFERVAFPRIKTYDNSATPTEDSTALEVKSAPVDSDALKAIIGDAVREAEASDPKKLKARIAELERAAQKAPVAVAVPSDTKAIDAAEARGFASGEIEGWNAGVEATRQMMIPRARAVSDALGELMIAEVPFRKRPSPAPVNRNTQNAVSGQVQHTLEVQPSKRPVTIAPKSEVSSSRPTAEVKALAALAELRALRVHEPTRSLVAAMAGYAHIKSRPIAEAFVVLTRDGLIAPAPGGSIKLTAAGVEAAPQVDHASTTEDMRHRIGAALGGAAEKALGVLIEAYPDALTRDEIAARCNYAHIKSRPIAEAFVKLAACGFADVPAPGQMKAAEILFP